MTDAEQYPPFVNSLPIAFGTIGLPASSYWVKISVCPKAGPTPTTAAIAASEPASIISHAVTIGIVLQRNQADVGSDV